MSLREELADRIEKAWWENQAGPPREYPANQYWLQAADECIRQMEWARSQAARSDIWINKTASQAATESPNFPLTLAPADWKP